MQKAITIEEKTRQRPAKFGNKLDSWDKILNSLMDHARSCDKWWADRYD